MLEGILMAPGNKSESEAIRCVACGQFISYDDCQQNILTTFHFIPDSHFGPEVSEWTCKKCNSKGLG